MIRAGRVDQNAAWRNCPDDRSNALQPSQRQPLQRFHVRDRIGLLHDQAGHEHLRLGGRHAGAQPVAYAACAPVTMRLLLSQPRIEMDSSR